MIEKAALELARKDPEFRKALIEKLSSASDGSIRAGIEASLGATSEELGSFLRSKYPVALKGAGRSYEKGYMIRGVSFEIENAVDRSRPGHLFIEARYEKYAVAKVVASFPKLREYSRMIQFGIEDSPKKVAKTLGPAFQRDLSNWMVEAVDAYGL